MKINAIVSTSKISNHGSSSSTIASSNNSLSDGNKIVELFHIRITSRHTKIDTMFDNGS